MLRAMSLGRRSFLVGSGLGALTACGPAARAPVPPVPGPRPPPVLPPAVHASLESVLDGALDAAKKAGATYADARVVRRRYERVGTREDHVREVSYSENYGVGVRVLAFGAWGFAAAASVSPASAKAAAQQAVAVAKADRGAQKRPIALAPVPAYHGVKYATPLEVDPFDVPVAEKAELLLAAWREARKVSGVSFLTGNAEAHGEWKLFASTEGSLIEQSITRVGCWYDVTATDKKTGEFVTRGTELPRAQAGWEMVTRSSLLADARKMGEDAAEKLKAPSVKPGKRDVILLPSHLWLTIHESMGHSTELDRAMGYEANLAGTSFATPDKLGKLKIGDPGVTVYADKTTPGGLATSGWDDDGVKCGRWDLVKDGLLVGYQTTRDQAAWIGEKTSRGCSYAQDHASVPFQRMPNVSLKPGDKTMSLADIVAATDDGVLIHGNGSWSIDHQRYNFQFGGQMFYEVKKGKITGALKDVAYQSNTIDFWHSCDMIADASHFEMHGTLHDGKGEPVQDNPVSHGCSPARFRKVNVLDTKRSKA